MVIKRLKGGKDWQNLPGGLTGSSKAMRTFELKNKNNTKPPKRGKGGSETKK